MRITIKTFSSNSFIYEEMLKISSYIDINHQLSMTVGIFSKINAALKDTLVRKDWCSVLKKPKLYQNLLFTPPSKTTSIPTLFTRESRSSKGV